MNTARLSLGAVVLAAAAVPAGAVTTQAINLTNDGSGGAVIFDGSTSVLVPGAGVTQITIGGNSLPQFGYYSENSFGTKNVATFFNQNGSRSLSSPVVGSEPAPFQDPVNFVGFSVQLGDSKTPSVDRYLPVTFEINGVQQIGNVYITPEHGLTNIAYQPLVAGVPEPEVWAELVAGFALAGAALRRRRAQPVVAA